MEGRLECMASMNRVDIITHVTRSGVANYCMCPNLDLHFSLMRPSLYDSVCLVSGQLHARNGRTRKLLLSR